MKLSFCIPTYNRKQLLEETVISILSQAQGEVDIVISDNHSTDGTDQYVTSLQRSYPGIIYYRWLQQVPCGDNLLKAVELAQGEYCWLMTDDDRVEPRGVEHVLSLLEKHQHLTGISVDVEGYDGSLKHRKKIRYSHHLKEDQLFLDAEEAFEKLGAWFGFWSGQIVHKKRWDAVVARGAHTQFLGYHHLYIILAMIQDAPQWLFTSRKCVGYRADNESFVKEYGRLKRFEIDAVSYTTIGGLFFNPSSVKKVNRLVLHKLLFWQLVTIKCEPHSLILLKDLFRVTLKYYRSYISFWCRLAPLFFIPRVVLRGVRYCYRLYKRCL